MVCLGPDVHLRRFRLPQDSDNNIIIITIFSQNQTGGLSFCFDLADEPSSHSSAPAGTAIPQPSSSSDEPTGSANRPSGQSAADRPGISSASGDRAAAPSSTPLRRSRRRRRESTPDPTENTGEAAKDRAEGDSGETGRGQSQRVDRDQAPSPKRRRLAGDNAMVPDSSRASHANGFSPRSKAGPGSPQRKPAVSGSLNGSSPHAASNGQSNGSLAGSPPPRLSPTYYGHDRGEVTRLIIQALYGLGYGDAASTLTRESAYELESPGVAAFKSAVLDGHWSQAERILLGSNFLPDDGGVMDGRFAEVDGGHSGPPEGLTLAEGAEKSELLFSLRQQKFLEFLDQRDLGSALLVLRQELTPLNHDTRQLHTLSSLLMCPAENLRAQIGWHGSVIQSRRDLLSHLSKSISPSVMIPEHRLATLLEQVKQIQINQCLYHNTAISPSLYSDHSCDRSNFPLRTAVELCQHTNEVWYLEFSHDGTKLATTSRDCSVIIYDAGTFDVVHKLTEHTDPVAYATWSPDDTRLITCSQDYKARLWDIETGRCVLTIDHHREPVTSAAWAPDGQTFVTGSLDNQSQLCLWSIQGQAIYTWPGSYRVRDCAISADGRRLIAISTDNRIYVYDFITREEEYSIRLNMDLTCINISQDSKFMLVNMSNSVVQLLDVETAAVVRQYVGQKQGNFIIRSTFGGAAENFVVSGSEDAKIYVWHKENSTLVEALGGHLPGCVNAVAWNPTNSGMFASAGDDHKVRIWTTEEPSNGGAVGKKKLPQASTSASQSAT